MALPASTNGTVPNTATVDGPAHAGPATAAPDGGGKADLLNVLLRDFPELTMQAVMDAVDEAWETVENVRTAPAFWLTYVDLLAREDLGRELLARHAPRPAISPTSAV